MPFDNLLRQRAIERYRVSDEEVAGHLQAGKHDIDFASSIAGQDLDWAFTIAYNGILQTSLAFMYQRGYRPTGEAKHYNTFRFLAEALPHEYAARISLLQRLRAKRNQAVYRSRGIVSAREATDMIAFSMQFYEEILGLLPREIVRMAGGREEENRS